MTEPVLLFAAHEKEIPAPAAPPHLRICRHRLAGNRASYRNMTQSTVFPVLVSFINHQMPLILIKFRSYSRQIQTVRLYFSYLRHYNITERRFCQVLSLRRPFPATYVPPPQHFLPRIKIFLILLLHIPEFCDIIIPLSNRSRGNTAVLRKSGTAVFGEVSKWS